MRSVSVTSRRIERRCREDVAFRVICANRAPDHATIARFRARHERALAEIFTQVLALCGKAGLASVGLVAVDGSLIAGDASPAATQTYAGDPRRGRGDARARPPEADAADDERFGEARGDELPPELADRRSRRERLRRCREQLEAEHAKQQADYEANLALAGRAGRPGTDASSVAASRSRPIPTRWPSATINTTDPDTRLMRRAGGRSVQGYNAQVVAQPAADHPGRRDHPVCSTTQASSSR